jgi:hypothetical protein
VLFVHQPPCDDTDAAARLLSMMLRLMSAALHAAMEQLQHSTTDEQCMSVDLSSAAVLLCCCPLPPHLMCGRYI